MEESKSKLTYKLLKLILLYIIMLCFTLYYIISYISLKRPISHVMFDNQDMCSDM